MDTLSIYIHVPFCSKRCTYCDFNTYSGLESLIPEYVDSIINEINIIAGEWGSPPAVHSIYFGGGTPSLLSPQMIFRILSAIELVFDLTFKHEISLEANPGTLSLSYLKGIKTVGVNRLSLGVQSSHPEELKLLGRQHDTFDVLNSTKWIRQAGFDNLSLDLIFGLPGRVESKWKRTLNFATHLNPEHFSLYALSIEEGTPMHTWWSRGLVSDTDQDMAADMYEIAQDHLTLAGYIQYEISNWTRKNVELEPIINHSERESDFSGPIRIISEFECLHNLQYWRNLPYLGLGAGAHGYIWGYRTINFRSPTTYINNLISYTGLSRSHSFPRTPGTSDLIRVNQETEMRETMMMGLRLTEEGVSNLRFQRRFGCSLMETFSEEIEKLVKLDLLTWRGETLKLTAKGRLLGNQVFMEFV
jgi:oxygen-independent coproporphyrinogen-3 oxidase